VKWIQSGFGPQAAHYTVALFTRVDDLRADGRSVDRLIGTGSSEPIWPCGTSSGNVAGDTTGWTRDSDPSQVAELLQKINSLVERNGGSEARRAAGAEPAGAALQVVWVLWVIGALAAVGFYISK